MCTDDRKALECKFDSAYYLALKERPFTDFPELLTLQEKMISKISVKLINNALYRGSYHRLLQTLITMLVSTMEVPI